MPSMQSEHSTRAVDEFRREYERRVMLYTQEIRQRFDRTVPRDDIRSRVVETNFSDCVEQDGTAENNSIHFGESWGNEEDTFVFDPSCSYYSESVEEPDPFAGEFPPPKLDGGELF